MLREQIAAWFAEHFAARLAEAAHPKPSTGIDTAQAARRQAEQDIKGLISDSEDEFSTMPGVKDLIEFSRSIHAEMTVLLNAARSAISPAETWLYCTTFPCHNCARHLVTAGVSRVYFIEPYVKSLAVDLHYDAIQTELAPSSQVGKARDWHNKMLILPFTGVGPRMYEDYFIKLGGLKDDVTGAYLPPAGGIPAHAVRLRELARVEEAAADLVPE
jgi:deoxycytidylate deaminase